MGWRAGDAVDIASARLERIKPAQVERFPAGHVPIEELAADGAGTLTFDTPGPSLRILPDHNNHPIGWYFENRCADGAVLLDRDGRVELHVAELKSQLDSKQWKKARTQLEGMLVNALAIAGALSLPAPDLVVCYLPYATETISAFVGANTSSWKVPLGAPAAPPSELSLATRDFNRGELTLADGQVVPVRWLVRDANGDASVDLR